MPQCHCQHFCQGLIVNVSATVDCQHYFQCYNVSASIISSATVLLPASLPVPQRQLYDLQNINISVSANDGARHSVYRTILVSVVSGQLLVPVFVPVPVPTFSLSI